MKCFLLILALAACLLWEPLFAGDPSCQGVAIFFSVRTETSVVTSRAIVVPGEQIEIPIKDGSFSLRPTILEDGSIEIAATLVTISVNGGGVNIVRLPKVTTVPGKPVVVAAADHEVAIAPQSVELS